MINQISLEPLKFKGIRQLLIEGWKIYCSKIKILLGIIALPVGFSIVPYLVFIPFYETYKYWFFILFIIPLWLIYGALIYKNLAEIKKEVPLQKPSGKGKYILPAILGFLIFGVIASFTFFNVFLGRDEPFPNDSDLWLPAIEIPKEENAFYYLIPYLNLSQPEKEIILRYRPEEKERLEEIREIYWPREKTELVDNIIRGKDWDEEFAKDLIKNNERLLIDFEKAVKSSNFQDPITQNPKNIDMTTLLLSLGNFRNIAKLNLVKATELLKQGKEKEAFDEAIKVIQLGHLLENSPRGPLIEYLFGMSIKQMGLDWLRFVLPEANLSPENLSYYIRQLEGFKENEEGLIRVFKMEYISFSNTKTKYVDPIIKGKASKERSEKSGEEILPQPAKILGRLNYFYKPNQTQRIFADWYRTNVNNAQKNYYKEMKFSEIRPLVPYSKIKILFTENLIGKILYDSTAGSLSGVHLRKCLDRKCLEDFSIIGTQTLMAIKAYKTETGEMPTSLEEELVPKYFSEVPKDPFDGNPIRYSASKKIIYSVGIDLIDSGGSEGDTLQKMADPTFHIEF